jgi:SAM-dependent methyltransferase
MVATQAKRRGLNIGDRTRISEVFLIHLSSFDVVASRFSAHHWHAWTEALTQMRRVVKPTGTAIFIDVVTPSAPLLDTWLQSLELLRDRPTCAMPH